MAMAGGGTYAEQREQSNQQIDVVVQEVKMRYTSIWNKYTVVDFVQDSYDS